MAEYAPKKFKSRLGKDVTVRSAIKRDAETILQVLKSVIDEEIWQLTSGSEFNVTIEEEEAWIEAHRTQPNHLILLAEMEGRIVGILDFANGHRQRIAHTGEFGISVDKSMRSHGIGSLLLQELIDWAGENKTIERIGLNVHGNNDRAVALYKKMGFQIEGIRKHHLKYGDGQYVDTVVMGRFV